MVYSMLQQQAKLSWLKCGDENSKVFYQAIRARRRHNKVHVIHDMDGKWLNKKEQVEEAFIKFYKNLFTGAEQKKVVLGTIMRRGKLVTEVHTRLLLAEFTKEDVKRVMFSIPNDNAPGIDGFNSYFFKHYWEVIGYKVCEAVLDFFRTGKLLKVINVTTLTLIPKVKVPEKVSEFHPITCCLMLYKCITKLIISERLNNILPDIVSTLVQKKQFASDVRRLFASDSGTTSKASTQITKNDLRRIRKRRKWLSYLRRTFIRCDADGSNVRRTSPRVRRK